MAEVETYMRIDLCWLLLHVVVSLTLNIDRDGCQGGMYPPLYTLYHVIKLILYYLVFHHVILYHEIISSRDIRSHDSFLHECVYHVIMYYMICFVTRAAVT